MSSRGGFVLVACLFATGPVWGQEGQHIPAFKQRALDCWRSVEREAVRGRVTSTIEWHFSRGGAPLALVRTDTVERTWTPKGHLFACKTSYLENGKEKEYIADHDIVNDQYQASLKQKRGTNEWALAGFLTPTASEKRNPGWGRFPWLVTFNNVLPEWFADPRVQIVRLEELGGPEGKPIRVHFRLDEAAPGAPPVDATIKGGYLDLDEASYFRPLGYRVDQVSKHSASVRTASYEYRPSKGIPVLWKTTVDTPDSRSEKFGLRSSQDIETFEIDYNADIDERVFWLSHYGLPEPQGVEAPPRATPRYVWFLVVGVIFALVGILFRVRAARVAKRTGATS